MGETQEFLLALLLSSLLGGWAASPAPESPLSFDLISSSLSAPEYIPPEAHFGDHPTPDDPLGIRRQLEFLSSQNTECGPDAELDVVILAIRSALPTESDCMCKCGGRMCPTPTPPPLWYDGLICQNTTCGGCPLVCPIPSNLSGTGLRDPANPTLLRCQANATAPCPKQWIAGELCPDAACYGCPSRCDVPNGSPRDTAKPFIQTCTEDNSTCPPRWIHGEPCVDDKCYGCPVICPVPKSNPRNILDPTAFVCSANASGCPPSWIAYEPCIDPSCWGCPVVCNISDPLRFRAPGTPADPLYPDTLTCLPAGPCPEPPYWTGYVCPVQPTLPTTPPATTPPPGFGSASGSGTFFNHTTNHTTGFGSYSGSGTFFTPTPTPVPSLPSGSGCNGCPTTCMTVTPQTVSAVPLSRDPSTALELTCQLGGCPPIWIDGETCPPPPTGYDPASNLLPSYCYGCPYVCNESATGVWPPTLPDVPICRPNALACRKLWNAGDTCLDSACRGCPTVCNLTEIYSGYIGSPLLCLGESGLCSSIQLWADNTTCPSGDPGCNGCPFVCPVRNPTNEIRCFATGPCPQNWIYGETCPDDNCYGCPLVCNRTINPFDPYTPVSDAKYCAGLSSVCPPVWSYAAPCFNFPNCMDCPLVCNETSIYSNYEYVDHCRGYDPSCPSFFSPPPFPDSTAPPMPSTTPFPLIESPPPSPTAPPPPTTAAALVVTTPPPTGCEPPPANFECPDISFDLSECLCSCPSVESTTLLTWIETYKSSTIHFKQCNFTCGLSPALAATAASVTAVTAAVVAASVAGSVGGSVAGSVAGSTAPAPGASIYKLIGAAQFMNVFGKVLDEDKEAPVPSAAKSAAGRRLLELHGSKRRALPDMCASDLNAEAPIGGQSSASAFSDAFGWANLKFEDLFKLRDIDSCAGKTLKEFWATVGTFLSGFLGTMLAGFGVETLIKRMFALMTGEAFAGKAVKFGEYELHSIKTAHLGLCNAAGAVLSGARFLNCPCGGWLIDALWGLGILFVLSVPGGFVIFMVVRLRNQKKRGKLKWVYNRPGRRLKKGESKEDKEEGANSFTHYAKFVWNAKGDQVKVVNPLQCYIVLKLTCGIGGALLVLLGGMGVMAADWEIKSISDFTAEQITALLMLVGGLFISFVPKFSQAKPGRWILTGITNLYASNVGKKYVFAWKDGLIETLDVPPRKNCLYPIVVLWTWLDAKGNAAGDKNALSLLRFRGDWMPQEDKGKEDVFGMFYKEYALTGIFFGIFLMFKNLLIGLFLMSDPQLAPKMVRVWITCMLFVFEVLGMVFLMPDKDLINGWGMAFQQAQQMIIIVVAALAASEVITKKQGGDFVIFFSVIQVSLAIPEQLWGVLCNTSLGGDNKIDFPLGKEEMKERIRAGKEEGAADKMAAARQAVSDMKALTPLAKKGDIKGVISAVFLNKDLLSTLEMLKPGAVLPFFLSIFENDMIRENIQMIADEVAPLRSTLKKLLDNPWETTEDLLTGLQASDCLKQVMEGITEMVSFVKKKDFVSAIGALMTKPKFIGVIAEQANVLPVLKTVMRNEKVVEEIGNAKMQMDLFIKRGIVKGPRAIIIEDAFDTLVNNPLEDMEDLTKVVSALEEGSKGMKKARELAKKGKDKKENGKKEEVVSEKDAAALLDEKPDERGITPEAALAQAEARKKQENATSLMTVATKDIAPDDCLGILSQFGEVLPQPLHKMFSAALDVSVVVGGLTDIKELLNGKKYVEALEGIIGKETFAKVLDKVSGGAVQGLMASVLSHQLVQEASEKLKESLDHVGMDDAKEVVDSLMANACGCPEELQQAFENIATLKEKVPLQDGKDALRQLLPLDKDAVVSMLKENVLPSAPEPVKQMLDDALGGQEDMLNAMKVVTAMVGKMRDGKYNEALAEMVGDCEAVLAINSLSGGSMQQMLQSLLASDAFSDGCYKVKSAHEGAADKIDELLEMEVGDDVQFKKALQMIQDVEAQNKGILVGMMPEKKDDVVDLVSPVVKSLPAVVKDKFDSGLLKKDDAKGSASGDKKAANGTANDGEGEENKADDSQESLGKGTDVKTPTPKKKKKGMFGMFRKKGGGNEEEVPLTESEEEVADSEEEVAQADGGKTPDTPTPKKKKGLMGMLGRKSGGEESAAEDSEEEVAQADGGKTPETPTKKKKRLMGKFKKIGKLGAMFSSPAKKKFKTEDGDEDDDDDEGGLDLSPQGIMAKMLNVNPEELLGAVDGLMDAMPGPVKMLMEQAMVAMKLKSQANEMRKEAKRTAKAAQQKNRDLDGPFTPKSPHSTTRTSQPTTPVNPFPAGQIATADLAYPSPAFYTGSGEAGGNPPGLDDDDDDDEPPPPPVPKRTTKPSEANLQMMEKMCGLPPSENAGYPLSPQRSRALPEVELGMPPQEEEEDEGPKSCIQRLRDSPEFLVFIPIVIFFFIGLFVVAALATSRDCGCCQCAATAAT